jgi:nucleotide-binding universal stress UspA family protein
MYKKVLVPLDGSQLSECSLEHVKDIATGCGATEVILLVVLDVQLPPMSTWGLPQAEQRVSFELESAFQKIRQPALDYLNEKSKQLQEAGISPRIEMLEEGPNQKTPDIIINYAQDNDIDLIIMSTHGRSGISRWLFGNVADRVVHYSRIPVMIVSPPGCRVKNTA